MGEEETKQTDTNHGIEPPDTAKLIQSLTHACVNIFMR